MSTILQYFEVRLRSKGQIISKHIPANSAEQAASYANGRVLSVKKVHKEDIIGIMPFKDIQEGNAEAIRVQKEIESKKKLGSDPILNNITLDSIVFGNGGEKSVRKEKKSPHKGRIDYEKEKARINRKYGIEADGN
jgi:hypothetical protein